MTTDLYQPTNGSWNARSLLTVPEVAEWARVHPKTVYRWIKDGKLEAFLLGPRTYRVPEDAIGQFLERVGYGQIPSPFKQNGRESP